MADQDWKSRLGDGRNSARAAVDHISSSAREAAATARSRIGTTYGTARNRADALAKEGRVIAASGLELGSKAAARSKSAVDKAVFASRGLIAERPMTALAIGVSAGIILGILANRLATSAHQPEEEDDSDTIGA